MRPRPPAGVMMGVEGLTLPSDPKATITATVARLVDPVRSQTSLQGLASHQAAVATSQVGMSTAATVIGTIHGPGLPGPITIAGCSNEPQISVLPPQEKKSQVFMVVGDDDIVEVGGAQGFTRIIEPKRERMDQPSIPLHASAGQGVGGGAYQGKPPRGGSRGCVTFPPAIEDLGVEEDDDNEFTEDPHNEEEEEVQFTYPDEEDDDNDDEEEDKDDNDEVQVVTRSRPRTSKSTPNEAVIFNPEINNITSYKKVDIIKLRNTAFNGDVMYAKRVKGTLLGLPPGSMPSSQQINSSELFALHAPAP